MTLKEIQVNKNLQTVLYIRRFSTLLVPFFTLKLGLPDLENKNTHLYVNFR